MNLENSYYTPFYIIYSVSHLAKILDVLRHCEEIALGLRVGFPTQSH